MKYIIEHMLKGIIVGTVVVVGISILGNINLVIKGKNAIGIYEMIGCIFTAEELKYSNLTDIETLRETVLVERPEITYNAHSTITSQTTLHLLDYFLIKYYDGNNYITETASNYGGNIKITEIKKAMGAYIEKDKEKDKVIDIGTYKETDMMKSYDVLTDNIIFQKAGVYEISFVVTDEENRQSVVEINVPVKQENL